MRLLLQQALLPLPEADEAEKPFLHHLVDLDVLSARQGVWVCQCGDRGPVKLTDYDMLTSIRHAHYRHVRVVRKRENAVSIGEGSSDERE